MVQSCDGIFDVGIVRWLISIGSSVADHLPRLPCRNSKFFAPFDDTHSLAINFHHAVGARIASLFFFCSPSAIVRLIISAVVFPVYRMFFTGLFSHISKEILETIDPPVAYGYSARSVDWVLMICRDVAPRFHAAPRKILSAMGSVVSSIVGISSQKICSGFLGETSATLRGFPDICCCGNGYFTAVALALPHYVTGTFNFHTPKHQKSVKTLSR